LQTFLNADVGKCNFIYNATIIDIEL